MSTRELAGLIVFGLAVFGAVVALCWLMLGAHLQRERRLDAEHAAADPMALARVAGVEVRSMSTGEPVWVPPERLAEILQLDLEDRPPRPGNPRNGARR